MLSAWPGPLPVYDLRRSHTLIPSSTSACRASICHPVPSDSRSGQPQILQACASRNRDSSRPSCTPILELGALPTSEARGLRLWRSSPNTSENLRCAKVAGSKIRMGRLDKRWNKKRVAILIARLATVGIGLLGTTPLRTLHGGSVRQPRNSDRRISRQARPPDLQPPGDFMSATSSSHPVTAPGSLVRFFATQTRS